MAGRFPYKHRPSTVYEPMPAEWQKALSAASKNLVVCPTNEHHHYGSHLGSECPWCARLSRGLPDPFPKDVPRVSPPRPRTSKASVAPAPATPDPPAPAPVEESPSKAKVLLALALIVIPLLMRMCG